MRTKKKKVFVIALFVSIVAFGQNKLELLREMPPDEMAQKVTAIQKEKLNLTEAQEEKIYAINLEAAKDRKEIANNSSVFGMRGKMGDLRETTNSKIQKELTPEQQELWRKHQEEMQEEIKQWMQSLNNK